MWVLYGNYQSNESENLKSNMAEGRHVEVEQYIFDYYSTVDCLIRTQFCLSVQNLITVTIERLKFRISKIQ